MKSSEIITNNDGSIYHLSLKPGQFAKDIIFVGDPFRVDIVSKYLNNIEFTIQNREFKSVTGYYDEKRISVISTGIGGSNIDIVINELDILFNYDFSERKWKKNHTSLNFIRIGTSGSISEDIPVDSFLLSESALDLNSQLSSYDLKNYSSINMSKIVLNNNQKLLCFKSSQDLFKKFDSNNIYKGLTATCNGFYNFQGRNTRIPLMTLIDFEDLNKLTHNGIIVTNLEMETAIIYGLSDFLGHQAVSLNAILANRVQKSYSENPTDVINSLIEYTLNRI